MWKWIFLATALIDVFNALVSVYISKGDLAVAWFTASATSFGAFFFMQDYYYKKKLR